MRLAHLLQKRPSGVALPSPDGHDVGMPANPAQVVTEDPEPAPNGPAGARTVKATVLDDEHPDVAVTFEYLVMPAKPLLSVGVHVHSRAADDPMHNATIGASAIREMPLARWDRTAQAAVVHLLSDVPSEQPQLPVATFAEELVNEKFPELNPPTDGHAARRRNSLIHLAGAAEEYARITATGERNPAGVLAQRRGTTASTVRGWIHRARREGLAPESRHRNATGSR